MTTMRILLSRVRALFRRRRLDDALDDDVRAHLELLAADYERRGMTAADARLAARRDFGGVEQMKATYRDGRGLRWLDDAERDVRYAVRSLASSPGFTLACTCILTLGIGLNLALFQLVNVTSLQPLPVKDPETLVRFYRLDPHGTNSTVPYPAAQFIGTNQNVLSAVLTQRFTDVAWEGNPVDRLRAAYVSVNWFQELGHGAARGRLFREDVDEHADAAPVVVLSYGFWQSRLGGDTSVIGSVVRVNDQPATVIGIAPAQFPGLRLLRDAQIWMPIEQIDLFTPGSEVKTAWRINSAEMYGRLRAGVGLAAAKDGLQITMRELARQRPGDFGADEWLEPYSASVRFETARDRRERLALTLAAGALTIMVLVVACASLGNLVLSRAGARRREVGIRAALGASRWRVMRQLMTESLVLASLGSAGGLVAGLSVARVIAAVTQLPPFLDFAPDWRTVVAALAAAVFAMIAVGLFPAWKVSQRGMATSLKDGGEQTSGGLERARFGQVLVGAQVGGSCLLLVIAGSMLQNLQRQILSGPGFDFENVAVLDASVSRYGITGSAARAYWSGVKQTIAGLPEAQSAALVSHAPVGRDLAQSIYRGAGSLQVTVLKVEPEFFGLMKIPILSGRNFTAADDPRTTAIISRRLALAMYGSLAVVGQAFPKIPSGPPGPTRTIVGVADDARLIRVSASDGAEQYSPVDPAEFASLVLVVRAKGDAAPLLAPMRDVARRADSRVLAEARLMQTDFDAKLWPIRLGSSVAGMLALLALSLACVGVFGLVAYGAVQRTKEIGIRVALGARRGDVVRMLVVQLLWPAVIGMFVGAAGAVPAARMLSRDPFFLPAFEPSIHMIVIALLTATVGVAALYPAVRVLRSDPLAALRYE